MDHWFVNLNLQERSNNEQVLHGVNNAVGHMDAGWVGSRRGESDVLRTHTAANKGLLGEVVVDVPLGDETLRCSLYGRAKLEVGSTTQGRDLVLGIMVWYGGVENNLENVSS